MAEQIEYLEKTRIWAAAGTPGRIAKILSESGMWYMLTDRTAATSQTFCR